MENPIVSKEGLQGTLADREEIIIDGLSWVLTQGRYKVVVLTYGGKSVTMFFNIENEVVAAKYFTLISFFNSGVSKQKDHYLRISGSLSTDNYASNFDFHYYYR